MNHERRIIHDERIGTFYADKVENMDDVPAGTLCFAYFDTQLPRTRINRNECLIWLGRGRFLTLHGIVNISNFFWVSWWQ